MELNMKIYVSWPQQKKTLYELIGKMEQLKFKNFIFINDYKNKWDSQIARLNHLSKTDLNNYSNLHSLISSNLKMNKDFKNLILKESKNTDKKYSNLEIKDKLSNFINHMTLNYDTFIKNNNFLKDKVFLSTIHGSKGLQFDVSFTCGLNSNSIPSYRDCANNCYEKTGELKKESLNLLNVAVSRSKNHLYLTSTHDHKTHETCILKPFYRYLKLSSK